MPLVLSGDGQITGLVDTFSWDQTTDNPMTSLAALTTGAGTWSINTNVQVVGTGHCRALSNLTLNPVATAHIVEVEVEIPSTLTTSGQHVRIGFAPDNAGASGYMNGGIRGEGAAYFERDNIAAMQTTPYTIPAAGTWVKMRFKWTVASNLFELWLGGVYQSSYIYAQAFSPTLKPYVVSYNAASQTARWRNLKAWSLTTNPSTPYPADPA